MVYSDLYLYKQLPPFVLECGVVANYLHTNNATTVELAVAGATWWQSNFIGIL